MRFLTLPMIVMGALCVDAASQSFTPGNLVVVHGSQLREYTPDGTQLSQVAVPHPTLSIADDAAGVVVDVLGRAHVLNISTFSGSFISTYDPLLGTWEHVSVTAFLGNISDGDLSILGSTLYTRGQRIDIATGDVDDIMLGTQNMREISAGADGMIYGITSSFFSGAFVASPDDLANPMSVPLKANTDVRGISADAGGNIFVADWNGNITKYDPQGKVLASTSTGTFNLLNIEVAANGTVVAGGRFGEVIVTDTSLSSVASFDVGGDIIGSWVTVVPQLGPNVSDVVPASTPWRAPQPVTVRGRFFTGQTVMEVLFGGLPATDVVVVDDTTITCTAPVHDPGPVAVEVRTDLLEGRAENAFHYTPTTLIEGTPSIGSSIDLSFEPEQLGDFLIVLVDSGPQTAVPLPGFEFDMCLQNPIVLFSTPAWPFAAFTTSLTVPSVPGIAGTEFLFQALTGQMPGRLTFSNCWSVTVQ